jgi:triosephosphate isomerase
MFFFGTNTKLQHTPDESVAFVREVTAFSNSGAVPADVQLWYAPPATSLLAVADMCRLNKIWLTAQNCHWQNLGAGTGELAPRVLKASGVEMVMLGHAERRTAHGESSRRIGAKVNAALGEGLRVLLCVGENKLENEYGIAQQTISAQLHIGLFTVTDAEINRVVVLYEPVWAIGDGAQAANPGDIAGAFRLIRDELVAMFGAAGRSTPLLYGGSVNAINAAIFSGIAGCAGLGVGRAAWRHQDFTHVLSVALSGRV